jgi:kynurenine 3-monooxygenase
LSAAPRGAVNIVGAGLAGSLLAVLLARRGFQVRVYEKRADPRTARLDGGRSINLALAARGIRGLERAGVLEAVMPAAIPMRGRMVHEHDGAAALQMYGVRPEEVIYSVGRADMNLRLIEAADAFDNVTLWFGQTALGLAPDGHAVELRDQAGRIYTADAAPTIATDGAGSPLRHALAERGIARVREDLLDHDYKELTIPARGGAPALDPKALHIWPRGGFMLIALPNPDASFTATLFLAKRGANSFEGLRSPIDVDAFFAREFPSARALMPGLAGEFFAHPRGELGTVYTEGWHARGDLLLLGDAAHAIVPFHGQGMNCAFEDCVELDELMGELDSSRAGSMESVFAEFERRRKPNTDAIAAMALENYVEMRAAVLDPDYRAKKAAAEAAEKRDPNAIPRYSMVMFHPEISYAEALRASAPPGAVDSAADSRS